MIDKEFTELAIECVEALRKQAEALKRLDLAGAKQAQLHYKELKARLEE